MSFSDRWMRSAAVALVAMTALCFGIATAPENPSTSTVRPLEVEAADEAIAERAARLEELLATEQNSLPVVLLTLPGNGRLEGLLVEEQEDRIMVRVAGHEQWFTTTQYVHRVTLQPVAEQFRYRYALLEPNDGVGRALFASFLRDKKRYELALYLVEEALALGETGPKVRELHAWLQQQIKLKPSSTPIRTADREAQEDLDERFPRLNDDEINLMRVFEYDFDRPTRLRVPRETRERFIQDYAGADGMPDSIQERAALLNARPGRVLELMFQVRARDLYSEVEVDGNPPAVELFRSKVHATWLMNNCATSRCHGGEEAGRLWLYNRGARSDRSVYTNLYILDQFKLADGRSLIDYENPEQSPLLQMAISREFSQSPHPPVVGDRRADEWRAEFRGVDDRRFQQAADWIRSMYTPRPDYGISYRPPLPASAIKTERPASERRER